MTKKKKKKKSAKTRIKKTHLTDEIPRNDLLIKSTHAFILRRRRADKSRWKVLPAADESLNCEWDDDVEVEKLDP